MTSSMFSGDRRWASSKRGGMTVLGKVAVPKPINLPSQRLENHGLDPNVEIVPKGTLSWGSKSSSSASNAWGSSSLSSNANGGTSSPSHLSTRPSSGGSGARPSTSGSDRAPELTTNAWGSNSRPSSASGALASNQTSLTSLRPRSAETRHGGSQLSRFAEHVTENSVAWSDARTTEKLGVARCKNDDFSLSSGDFPTLGSEKDKSVQIIELQDHSSHTRPGSSSGLRRENNETSTADDVHGNANVSETTNSWRRDYQAYNEDDVRPGTEKWQGNLQSYPNAGIPPQHFDAWHGVPINNHQGDAWFRGPPNGPPYANSVAPGGFPIEPFPYYRPHLPPAGLPNQPQVPLPGTGPRGHHKNGDVYRPHMPDAYIHPGMSLRPGFYPGPMACEGYYSPPPPPMGYRNSNEQDVPFMGMAARPSVYNRYSNQNPPKPGNSQGRSGGYGPAGNPLASELVESCHTSDTAGSYRVLVKQHNGQDGKNEQTNWEDSVTSNTSYVNGRDQPGMSFGENDHKRNEEMDLKRTSAHGEQASQTLGNRGPSSFIINAQSPESTRSFNKIDDISVRELDGVASNVLEIPSRPSAPKDSSLIQKIKGLNAKARDNSSAQSKEEQRGKFHAGNHDENEVSAGVVFPETTCATEVINPTTYGVGASGGENNFESLSFSGTVPSRRIVHGMQGRGNHRKGRLNNQDADSGQKKSGIIDSSTSSDAQLEISNILVDDHEISVDAYERSESYSQARHDAESMQNLSDSVDSHAQHAKRKELAKKQTKKLQEEEEEWTRKQKAKALAKLDELNRCSQSVEGSMQKEYAANFALQNKLEECQPSATVLGKSGAVNSPVMFNANVVCQISDTNINKVEKLPVLSSEPPLETLKNAGKERHNQSVTLHQDFNCADATNALQVHNNTVSKQKKMGYKQKQNLSSEKTLKEMVVSTTSTAPKIEDDTMACVMVSSGIVTNEVSSASGSILPLKSNSMVESSVNQKKKHNRNSKNKHKVEETSSLAALPSIISKEAIFSKSSVESDKPNKHIELDQGLVQSAPLSKDSNQYSVQKSFVREESYDSMNSQSKSQHSRRMPRNAQANRQSEKSHGSDAVMWAPVKTQNKTQIVDESTENSQIEGIIPVKSDQQVHNLKNKRAEMERYIPKPVAKEMVQQGSLQAASSISQDPTNESVERVDSSSQGPQITRHTNSAIGKLGSRMLSKNGDSWQTKQGKTHGTWRQRNPTESTDVHGMQNGVNHGSNTDQNIQIPLVRQQARMSETRFLNDQTEHFNDSGEPNGSNNPDNHDSAALISTPIIKDRTAIVGERRVPFGGQKSTVMNHDVQKKNGGDTQKTETPFSSSEHGEPDGAVHKENRITGEHMSSHWQPKYQASNNRRGNRPNYQHVGSQVIQPNQKESTSQVVSFPDDGCDKESNALVAQPPPDQSGSGKSKGGETPNLGNNAEAKRERRNDPPKGRPHSPNQVAVRSSEQPASMDPSHEQRSSSGFRKNGNQNRFGKGHEFQGDWKSPAQDNRHHNQPTNRDKQGSNLRYEYHPVGPYDDSKADNSERPKDGSYHNRGRFRERGQTHRIRGGGNFLDAS